MSATSPVTPTDEGSVVSKPTAPISLRALEWCARGLNGQLAAIPMPPPPPPPNRWATPPPASMKPDLTQADLQGLVMHLCRALERAKAYHATKEITDAGQELLSRSLRSAVRGTLESHGAPNSTVASLRPLDDTASGMITQFRPPPPTSAATTGPNTAPAASATSVTPPSDATVALTDLDQYLRLHSAYPAPPSVTSCEKMHQLISAMFHGATERSWSQQDLFSCVDKRRKMRSQPWEALSGALTLEDRGILDVFFEEESQELLRQRHLNVVRQLGVLRDARDALSTAAPHTPDPLRAGGTGVRDEGAHHRPTDRSRGPLDVTPRETERCAPVVSPSGDIPMYVLLEWLPDPKDADIPRRPISPSQPSNATHGSSSGAAPSDRLTVKQRPPLLKFQKTRSLPVFEYNEASRERLRRTLVGFFEQFDPKWGLPKIRAFLAAAATEKALLRQIRRRYLPASFAVIERSLPHRVVPSIVVEYVLSAFVSVHHLRRFSQAALLNPGAASPTSAVDNSDGCDLD